MASLYVDMHNPASTRSVYGMFHAEKSQVPVDSRTESWSSASIKNDV